MRQLLIALVAIAVLYPASAARAQGEVGAVPVDVPAVSNTAVAQTTVQTPATPASAVAPTRLIIAGQVDVNFHQPAAPAAAVESARPARARRHNGGSGTATNGVTAASITLVGNSLKKFEANRERDQNVVVQKMDAAGQKLDGVAAAQGTLSENQGNLATAVKAVGDSVAGLQSIVVQNRATDGQELAGIRRNQTYQWWALALLVVLAIVNHRRVAGIGKTLRTWGSAGTPYIP